MNLHPDDTIAALASAPGSAERGIIRASGPQVAAILAPLFAARNGDAWPDSRTASVHPGHLRVGGLSRPVPTDLYFWPNRRSYTGEPLAELHLVGSPPILEAALATLYKAGMRPAQPGEFTLRAFLAGRIDLMQAEAVLGVIDAGDQRELQTALEQLAGGISTRIGGLRSDLLDLLADLEAGLDFADEAIEFVSHAALIERLLAHRATLDGLIQRSSERTRGSALPRVVLAGPPNAGKSTLFNVLVGYGAALVSDVAGTTRDYLAAEVSWSGLTLLLVDTAGSEEAFAGIAGESQRLRREQLERADLIVWCDPADDPAPDRVGDPSGDATSVSPEIAIERPALHVRTKADLPASHANASLLPISALTGAGLADLKAAIVRQLSSPAFGERQWIGSTAARCRKSLLGAAAALDRAIGIARLEADQELLAIETREALDELGEVVGAVYTDDILDRIFSKFCIGK